MAKHTRPLSVLLMLAFAACSGDSSSSTEKEEMAVGAAGGADASGAFAPAAPPPAPPAMQSDGLALAERAAARDADLAQVQQAPQVLPGAVFDSTPAMIIRTGEARVEVDSLEASVAQVERAAAALGGWIAHSSLQLGEQQWRTARLEVKIPADRWEEMVGGLDAIGELRQLTTATEDVGEQFVDVTAQLSNARRLEERYLQLLENRTGSLEDLLAVERELARVRERIERMQGRLRYLSQRVAVSTLVVTLEEQTDLLSTVPGEQPMRDALRGAWRNFVGVITGGIELLGAVLPIALLLAAGLWGWRRVRRGRRTAAEAAGRAEAAARE